MKICLDAGHYKKEHLNEEQAKKQMIEIIKEAFKCQRESNTTNS